MARTLLTSLLVFTVMFYTAESRLLPSVVGTIIGSLGSSEITQKSFCDQLSGLPEGMKTWCRKYTSFLPAIGMGADLALKECQTRFQYDRWNCKLDDERFRNVAQWESRETAFVDAIVSAGVMMAISRTCSKGNLTKYCGCDKSVLDDDSNVGQFEWGGCGDDFQKGRQYSRAFLDVGAKEALPSAIPQLPASSIIQSTATGQQRSRLSELVHKWNNRRGRLAVDDTLTTVCKCHGLCGACTVQICWKEVPSVNKIGALLKSSYRDAKQVQLLSPRSPVLVPTSSGPVTDISQLTNGPGLSAKSSVYTSDSPDFCFRNDTVGIHGTAHRQCNKNSRGEDGCELLCCGNGYYETRTVKRVQCQCKFVWCCEVRCVWCDRVYQHYHCKTPRPGAARK